jgi:hypothetical protein
MAVTFSAPGSAPLICRWIGTDNFNSNRYEESDAYYNPSAIKKIDRLFNLCDSLGLYVMLTLGPGNYACAMVVSRRRRLIFL